MLSIGKLVAGSEDYYLRTVAAGREEYYLGSGEAPGRWIGAGARVLGLSGEVGGADLRVLLAGFSPDGERLGSVPTGRRRVAGFDLTFSPTKSVSLLWGLSDEATSETVRGAHDQAVIEALGYLERHATKARRGAGGEVRIGADGLVGAAFRHRTSRNGDPQLHTHVLVANAVRAEDGRWSAPDARLLYFHARTAGFLYQAALRVKLATGLGVSFGPIENGCGEAAGVDEGMVRAFSSRRTAIEEALERRGFRGRRAAEVATLETRPAKEQTPERTREIASLHDTWRQRARDSGFDLGDLRRALGQPRLVEADARTADALAEHFLGPDGLTSRASTFERRDVVRAVAEHLVDGANVADIERLTDDVLARPETVRLDLDGHGGEPLHTTTELLEIERNLLKAAEDRRGQGIAVADGHLVDQALDDRRGLSAEQEALVRRLTGSGDGLEAVVGKAGSGKTHALAAARAAWERAGVRVSGVALAARAAAELEAATGIPADTYAALAARLERGEARLASGSVLVVDEAGMLGTRALARMADAAGATGAKLVLVGDHRQLPEIEAGGAFGGLTGLPGVFTLTHNQRQAQPWERAALDELRSGDVATALTAYGERDRLHLQPSGPEALDSLVADWLESREKGSTTMLAASRVEVEGLNARARAALRQRRQLGPDVVQAGGRGFAIGDEVLCLRNDRRRSVRNGTRGTLLEVSGPSAIIGAEGGRFRLALDYVEDGWLVHAYATTIHKAQGATFDRAFVLATDTLYREAGYVALSRARLRTDVYVVEGVFGLTGPSPSAFPGWMESLRRSISESRAKALASSYRPMDQRIERARPTRLPDRGRGR